MESLYARVIERLPLGLTVWKLEDVQYPGSFRLIASNPQIDDATGIRFATFIGTTVRESFPTSLETDGPHIYAEAVRTGQVQRLPDLERYGDEIEREGAVFAVTAVPLGGPLVAIFAENVTERNRSEEELHRLALAIDTIHESVVIAGMDGKLLYVNSGAERLFGYSRGEMVGINVFDLHQRVSRGTEAKDIFEATVRDGSWSGEVVQQRKSGEEFPTRLSTALVRQEDGRPTGMIGISADLTEQQQLEAQLLQAQKMEAVGLLAGDIAHDLNNLLTVILSYPQLGMRGEIKGGQVFQYQQEVFQAGERATLLTNQLLAFSRQQLIEPKVLNLNDLILNVDSLLRRVIGTDIELVTLPSADLGMVRADPGQMEQVLVNLAINASDAMPQGGKPLVRTSNLTVDDDYAREVPCLETGSYILVQVADTGVGMHGDVAVRAFDPFFTTKDKEGRSRLGLSTCHGIISQNGGHISVDSHPGQGTTFRILLPRSEEQASRLYPPGEDHGPLPSGNETVLLVDDEPSVLAVVSQVLRERGYTVLEAANGIDALGLAEEYSSGDIHLLFADIVMPLMSGSELADRIAERHPETKLLFTSGYGYHPADRPAVSSLAGNFIQKPFTPATLVRKVRETLDSN